MTAESPFSRSPTSPGRLPASSDLVASEVAEMLTALIEARSGLSAIHQLLDGATTMAEIRARYARWLAHQKTLP